MEVRPLTDAAAGALFRMRIAAAFAGSLAGIGLLLVFTGLYSSVSYATRRRTREMAIRAAVASDDHRLLDGAWMRTGTAQKTSGTTGHCPCRWIAGKWRCTITSTLSRPLVLLAEFGEANGVD